MRDRNTLWALIISTMAPVMAAQAQPLPPVPPAPSDDVAAMTQIQRSILVLKSRVEQAKLDAELRKLQNEGSSIPAPAFAAAPAAVRPAPPRATDAPSTAQGRPATGNSGVLLVSGARGKMTATLMLRDGTELPVQIGTILPTGETVTSIDRSGVALTADGTVQRMTFVPGPSLTTTRTAQATIGATPSAAPATSQPAR